VACPSSACLDQLIEAASKVTSAYQAKRKLQATAPIEKALEKALSAAFKKQGSAFLGRFAKRSGDFPNLTEAATPVPDWESDFDAAAEETVEAFEKPLSAAVQAALQAGSKASLATAGFDIAWDLKSPGAIAYMKEHGAELVSKIGDVSKEQIRGIMAQALDEGWSYNQTAKVLTEKFAQFAVGSPLAHIDSRAHLIATTEASHAYSFAQNATVQELVDAGLDMEKEWIVAGGNVCDDCAMNGAAGWIPWDADYPSGWHTQGESHPGCRCAEGQRRAVGAKVPATAPSPEPEVQTPKAAPAPPAPTPEAQRFTDDMAGRKFVKDGWADWRAGMSKAEDGGLAFYQSPGYELMNGQLRGTTLNASAADLKRAAEASKNLTKAIAKAPPLESDLTVFRGFSAEQFELKAGAIVQDNGFVSTAITKEGVSAVTKVGTQAVAEIYVPAGTQMAAGYTRELILAPGSRFEIISAVKKGKTWEVKMKLLV
jgi:hypothetical protein